MDQLADSPPPESDEAVSLYSPARNRIGVAAMAIVLQTAALALGAITVGSVIDRAIVAAPPGPALITLGALFALAVAMSALVEWMEPKISVAVAGHARRRVLLAAGAVEGDPDARIGDVLALSMDAADSVGELAGRFLPQLISGVVAPFVIVGFGASIDLPSAIALAVAVPVVPALLRMLEKRFASVSEKYRRTSDELRARFLTGIQGIRTLKALDRVGVYEEDLAESAESLRSDTMALLRVNQLALFGVDSLFTIGTIVLAAAMAMWRLDSGAIGAGDGVALVLLGVGLIAPLSRIGRFFYVGAIGRASAARIKDFLPGSPGLARPDRVEGPDSGRISVVEAVFRYPSTGRGVGPVSFHIEPGESVALIGPSGSGKSTLARLLVGLLEPHTGEISVGGRVAYVPQFPSLFDGTVRHNLELLVPGATQTEMASALDAVGLSSSSVGGLGPDTRVGEGGVALSGGEGQRLAIAAALLADADVVVLDEPSANLDSHNETSLKDAISTLADGRTIVVVAHRRSTVAGSDVVIALDDDDGFLVARRGDPGFSDVLTRLEVGK